MIFSPLIIILVSYVLIKSKNMILFKLTDKIATGIICCENDNKILKLDNDKSTDILSDV